MAARRVRADLSWRRALEMAADSREAAPWTGIRWSTIHVSLESPLGARREATHAGRGSQPKERHGVVAEVLMIDSRRKSPVRRVFE
jgi:hypothetical protein